MVLTWVFVGLLLAGTIARINQSNKLFWILFTSFMVGIAGSAVYNKYCTTQCKTESSSQRHTLLTCNTMSNISFVTIDENMCPSVSTPTAASNGRLEFNDAVEALSKCCVETRKQPPRYLNLKLKKVCWSILTRPESQELS